MKITLLFIVLSVLGVISTDVSNISTIKNDTLNVKVENDQKESNNTQVTIDLDTLSKLVAEKQENGLPDWVLITLPVLIGAIITLFLNDRQQKLGFKHSKALIEQEREGAITKVLLEERIKAHQELLLHLSHCSTFTYMNGEIEDATLTLCTSYKIHAEIQTKLFSIYNTKRTFLTQDVYEKASNLDMLLKAMRDITTDENSLIQCGKEFKDEILLAVNLCTIAIGDFFEVGIATPYSFPRGIPNLDGVYEYKLFSRYQDYLEKKVVKKIK